MKSQCRIGLVPQQRVHQHAWFTRGRGMRVARFVTQHIDWIPLDRIVFRCKHVVVEHLHACEFGWSSREEVD